MFKLTIRCGCCNGEWYKDGNVVQNGTASQKKCNVCDIHGSMIGNKHISD